MTTTTPRTWLWPDHVIGTRESRRLRDEHNALMDSHEVLLEACQQVVWKLSHAYSPSGNGGDCRPVSIDRNDVAIAMVRAAIAKATGVTR